MTGTTDSTPASTPENRNRRKWPLGWLIFIGLLIIGWLISFFMTSSAMNSQRKVYRKEIRQQIMEKGKLIAASFRQTDSAILSENGQQLAQGYFSEIMQDENIVFITVLDRNGVVRATSDLRFLREPIQKLPNLSGKTISRQGSGGANLEFFGPINDANGKQVGAVLVGISYGKDVTAK